MYRQAVGYLILILITLVMLSSVGAEQLGEFTYPLDGKSYDNISSVTGTTSGTNIVGGGILIKHDTLGYWNQMSRSYSLSGNTEMFIMGPYTSTSGNYASWMINTSNVDWKEGNYTIYLRVGTPSGPIDNVDTVSFTIGDVVNEIPPVTEDYNTIKSPYDSVPVDKIWSVRFNIGIDPQGIEEYISIWEVTESGLEKFSSSVEISSEDNKVVEVLHAENFVEDKEYQLIIEPGILSESGNILNNGYVLDFAVEGEVSNEEGAIQGVVTSGGKAVSGVTVNVIGTSYSAVTDANGNYTISGLESGDYWLEFLHDYYYDDISANQISIYNGGTTFNKTMSVGAVIAGKVTYNGVGISGVLVQDILAGTKTITDANGNYRLSGVPANSLRPIVRYINFTHSIYSIDEAVEITVNSGKTTIADTVQMNK